MSFDFTVKDPEPLRKKANSGLRCACGRRKGRVQDFCLACRSRRSILPNKPQAHDSIVARISPRLREQIQRIAVEEGATLMKASNIAADRLASGVKKA